MNNNAIDNVSTLTFCWQISRNDGTVLHFTNHTQDIAFNGTTYIATSGFTHSEIVQSIKTEQKSFEIDGIIDNVIISENDLLCGMYDRATIDLLLVDYQNPTNNNMLLRRGYINDITIAGNVFIAEICNILSVAANELCANYSASCRATFGNKQCGIDLASCSFNGAVEQLISQTVFLDSSLPNENGYYKAGTIAFTSGLNKGFTTTICGHANHKIALAERPYFALQIGNKYTVTAGCDKSIETCFKKFHNQDNFRGEPYLPSPISN